MPYLPFAEMLAQLDGAPELAAHPALEQLRRRATGAGEGLDRAEVLESVAALVEDLAAERPLVLVVEDAHWADASTRDLLSFLVARRVPGRFLVLVTFRSDEMHRRHPLRRQVAEWVRLPGVERLQLEPLPASAVRTMVEEILGHSDEAYDADVARIVERAQGNAFYVEELVGAFLGGGWSLPEDLADLLLVRLERLPPTAREVVRTASAAGQRVPHGLLARVSPLPDDQLDLALREAIDAGVLVRAGDSAYAFRHALLGEAVYDDLLPGERMRLHTAYAEAVRALPGTRGCRRPRPARARLPRPAHRADGQHRRGRPGPGQRRARRGRAALLPRARDPRQRRRRGRARRDRPRHAHRRGALRRRATGDRDGARRLPPRPAARHGPAARPGAAARGPAGGDARHRAGRQPDRDGRGGARAAGAGRGPAAHPRARELRHHAAVGGPVRRGARGGRGGRRACRGAGPPTAGGRRRPDA